MGALAEDYQSVPILIVALGAPLGNQMPKAKSACGRSLFNDKKRIRHYLSLQMTLRCPGKWWRRD